MAEQHHRRALIIEIQFEVTRALRVPRNRSVKFSNVELFDGELSACLFAELTLVGWSCRHCGQRPSCVRSASDHLIIAHELFSVT